MADAIRLRRRRTFAAQAEQYAAHRPTYPPALWERLRAYAALERGSRVLEVGPGTGQATASMAARGWAVTAVELSPELAAVARRQLAEATRVEVVVAAFEEWEPPTEPYDAFVCATAYHWLDPATRLTRIVSALRPGGTVAIIWTHHVAGGTADFFVDAQSSYLRWDPDARPDHRLPDEREVVPSTTELLGSALVTDVESHSFGVEGAYSAADYVALLGTYSSTLDLPVASQEGLLTEIGDLITNRYGGTITKRYLFELVLARTVG